MKNTDSPSPRRTREATLGVAVAGRPRVAAVEERFVRAVKDQGVGVLQALHAAHPTLSWPDTWRAMAPSQPEIELVLIEGVRPAGADPEAIGAVPVEHARWLIEHAQTLGLKGLRPDEGKVWEWPLLMTAVLATQPGWMQALLEAGHSVNEPGPDGSTPLYRCRGLSYMSPRAQAVRSVLLGAGAVLKSDQILMWIHDRGNPGARRALNEVATSTYASVWHERDHWGQLPLTMFSAALRSDPEPMMPTALALRALGVTFEADLEDGIDRAAAQAQAQALDAGLPSAPTRTSALRL